MDTRTFIFRPHRSRGFIFRSSQVEAFSVSYGNGTQSRFSSRRVVDLDFSGFKVLISGDGTCGSVFSRFYFITDSVSFVSEGEIVSTSA